MYKRLLNIPQDSRSSAFLFGPRGCGKTYWVKLHFPKAIYLDLLNQDLFIKYSSRPSSLREDIPEGFSDWIIIDEVQKVPEILNEVHRLIEEKGYRFILTGSSARSLRRRGVNLLAGRALLYHMHPLTPQELENDFNLEESMRFGLLPKVIHNEDAKHYLASYITTYLREEILQEGILRNLETFSRFLEIASYSQGSPINYSSIARDTYASRKVVTSYFTILEDLLIAKQVPPFTKRAKRAIKTANKFYYFDTGVYQHLRPRGIADSGPQIDGTALETLFFQTVSALNDYLALGYKIYYWQTRSQLEVGFVLYGEKGFFAFEIKLSRFTKSEMFKGLRAFKEDYPEAKLYLINMGDRKEYHGDVTIIPMQECLKELPNILQSYEL